MAEELGDGEVFGSDLGIGEDGGHVLVDEKLLAVGVLREPVDEVHGLALHGGVGAGGDGEWQ